LSDELELRLSEKTYLHRLIVTIALLCGLLLLWWLRIVILLLFASAIFAIAITSLARPLQRRFRLPHGASAIMAILGVAAVSALMIVFFGWRVAGQYSQLVELLPKAFANALAWLNNQPFGAPIAKSIRASAATPALSAIMHIPAYALTLIGGIAELLLIVAGGIYFAYQPELYANAIMKMVPPAQRGAARATLDEIAETLRKWLLAQLAAMAMVGSLVTIGTWALGVPAAGALGVFAGAVEFIPIAGPIVSAIPALLLAMLIGVETAGWTAILFVAIQQVEGNLIIPLIQQQAIKIPPVVTLFALIAFGVIFGPLGIILAMPLTIVVFVAVKPYLS
jgi:predicted PurR-regulated permease PerM